MDYLNDNLNLLAYIIFDQKFNWKKKIFKAKKPKFFNWKNQI